MLPYPQTSIDLPLTANLQVNFPTGHWLLIWLRSEDGIVPTANDILVFLLHIELSPVQTWHSPTPLYSQTFKRSCISLGTPQTAVLYLLSCAPPGFTIDHHQDWAPQWISHPKATMQMPDVIRDYWNLNEASTFPNKFWDAFKGCMRGHYISLQKAITTK